MISKDLILLLLADKSRRRRQTQCRRHFLCVSVLGKKIICISAVSGGVDPDKGRTTKPCNYLNIRPCLLGLALSHTHTTLPNICVLIQVMQRVLLRRRAKTHDFQSSAAASAAGTQRALSSWKLSETTFLVGLQSCKSHSLQRKSFCSLVQKSCVMPHSVVFHESRLNGPQHFYHCNSRNYSPNR